jgi:hypothetical protein
MRLRTDAIAAALLAAAIPAAADDLTIVSKTTRDGAAPTTVTSYLSTDHARSSAGNGQEAIIDFRTGQITMVDNNKKEYFVITRADMDQMKARMQQAMNSPEMQRAQEQMKNLPPEVQKRMQGMMGAVASVDVHKTGTSRKIAGYSCDDWSMTMGQFSKTEQCLTTELPLPPAAWASYKEFADSMQGMMASMGPMAKGIADMQAKMKEMRGYPLAATTTAGMMGRSITTSTEVVEVKKGAVPASAWEVPAGYRKVDNPMLKAATTR